MFFDEKDNPQGAAMSPAGHSMSADQICAALKALIQKESAEGDETDVKKLQQAYDLVEEFKGEESAEPEEKEEGSEDSKPEATEKPEMGADMLLGPMGKLKNYLAKASVDHQSQM